MRSIIGIGQWLVGLYMKSVSVSFDGDFYSVSFGEKEKRARCVLGYHYPESNTLIQSKFQLTSFFQGNKSIYLKLFGIGGKLYQ